LVAWIALIASITLAFAVWLLGWWIPSIWHLDQARHWPVVEGTVESFDIRGIEDDDHDWIYVLDFRVRYHAGGSHTCDALRLGRDDVYDSEQEARLAWAKVAAGGRASVYFDPLNPARSVLLPGASPGELRMAAFLIALFVLMGIALPHLGWVLIGPELSRDEKKARQHKESAYTGAGCAILGLAGIILFGCWIFGLPWPATWVGAGILCGVLVVLSSGAAVGAYLDPDFRWRG
jgi:hypothetical protein